MNICVLFVLIRRITYFSLGKPFELKIGLPNGNPERGFATLCGQPWVRSTKQSFYLSEATRAFLS